ncbi:MAG TPA: GNAT family N-acetyltransferase, partial [Colwellia sp.]|nr:GNAT family N-acetyltransferase [Colwellia sp.]
MKITLIQADYHNEQHGKDLIMLLNAYALDPMGGGEALSDHTQQNLIATIAKRNDFLTL